MKKGKQELYLQNDQEMADYLIRKAAEERTVRGPAAGSGRARPWSTCLATSLNSGATAKPSNLRGLAGDRGRIVARPGFPLPG